MLSRGAPMKRVGFKPKMPARPAREDRARPPLTPIRKVAPFVLGFAPTPKRVYVVNEDYRRAVASLPCFRCGIVGFSNACHSDSSQDGKGERIKACDLSCWPGCVTRGVGEPGCHYLVGMTTLMNRGEKRAFESRAAAATQAALIEQAAGDRKLHTVLVKVGLIGGAA